MSNDIANPDVSGYKADAGETTTPQTAPRARANFKLPTWDECKAVPTGERNALQQFVYEYGYDDYYNLNRWRAALADVLAEVSPTLPIVCTATAEDVAALRDAWNNAEHCATLTLVSDDLPWQLRDSYRGTPGTRVWFWWYREGVPPTMDDAWIGGDGKIASKGDGWAHRYSHVMPVEPPVTVPDSEDL